MCQLQSLTSAETELGPGEGGHFSCHISEARDCSAGNRGGTYGVVGGGDSGSEDQEI